ncbi:hypothetical protein Cabys_2263 [Caldithrix abyssi DSM 13497]|uniref:Uncharacterized protein n=1 Tax=Caldithrix abyssi DSM 13497 TaxID=880073 RepID=A0A1J1C9D6_CALAY|nr:hypothetical protein Cabys_2263 [Caldithrix abyssi DSM 13497]
MFSCGRAATKTNRNARKVIFYSTVFFTAKTVSTEVFCCGSAASD